MNGNFEPTAFDDVIRQGLRAASADLPIPGLAQRAMAIASSHGRLSIRKAKSFTWHRVVTTLGITAIIVIVFFGSPSLSGLFGSDQTTSAANNDSMTAAAWNFTWIVIAGAVSFAAIVFANLFRPPSDVSERMFMTV